MGKLQQSMFEGVVGLAAFILLIRGRKQK